MTFTSGAPRLAAAKVFPLLGSGNFGNLFIQQDHFLNEPPEECPSVRTLGTFDPGVHPKRRPEKPFPGLTFV
jgi:hypothetical protein